MSSTTKSFVHQKTTRLSDSLSSYVNGVFRFMSLSLSITGVVAFFSLKSGISHAIFSNSILSLIVMFAPLFLSMNVSAKASNMDHSGAFSWLVVYAIAMGMSLSFIGLYTSPIIVAKAFVISALMFLSAAIYGYVFKGDLTKNRSMVMMGVFGIIIASIANIFIRSMAFDFIISIVCVVIFSFATAMHMQELKYMYYQYAHKGEVEARSLAVIGALNLYISFVNIFVSMIRILQMGSSRRN